MQGKTPANAIKKEGPPLLRVIYGFTLRTHNRVPSFTKQHRYTLGQELKEQALRLTLLIVGANSENALSLRIAKLGEATTQLAKLKITLRLAYDLHCFSAKGHAHLLTSREDTWRQLSGWLNYVFGAILACSSS